MSSYFCAFLGVDVTSGWSACNRGSRTKHEDARGFRCYLFLRWAGFCCCSTESCQWDVSHLEQYVLPFNAYNANTFQSSLVTWRLFSFIVVQWHMFSHDPFNPFKKILKMAKQVTWCPLTTPRTGSKGGKWGGGCSLHTAQWKLGQCSRRKRWNPGPYRQKYEAAMARGAKTFGIGQKRKLARGRSRGVMLLQPIPSGKHLPPRGSSVCGLRGLSPVCWSS